MITHFSRRCGAQQSLLMDYIHPWLCCWRPLARVRGNKSVKNAEIWNYLPDLGEDINFNQLQLIFIIDFLLSLSLGLIYLSCSAAWASVQAEHKLAIVNCYMCKVSEEDSKILPPNVTLFMAAAFLNQRNLLELSVRLLILGLTGEIL